MNPTRLEALSSLRFFAAFAVLMLHFMPFLALPPVLAAFAREGRAGVSFFFVLSGFILYYTYHTRFADRLDSAALKRFFQARFARVYPLHVLTLVAITPIVLIQLMDPRLAIERYGAQVVKPLHVALSWLTNLTLVNVYVPAVGGGVFTYAFLWNAPAWSIACEAVFYLTFPFFAAWVLGRFTTRRALWGLVLGLYAAEWLGVLAATAITPPWLGDYVAYHWPVFRVWEFFLGAACGKLFVMRGDAATGTPWGRSGLVVGIAAAIAGLALLAAPAGQIHAFLAAGFDYAFYTPLFALLIYWTAIGSGPVTRALEWRPLVILGEASYSLYMLHWLPVTMLKHAKLQGAMLPVPGVWAIIGGVVLASVLCYYGFEGPVRRWLRPRPEPEVGLAVPPVGPAASA